VATDQEGTTPPGAPWAQQPGESDLQHRRFTTYRDLGPDRTYLAAQQALAQAGDTVSLSYLRSVGSSHNWKRRVDAYDGRTPTVRTFRLAADRDPWEQQDDESDRMYSRFDAYLRLGRARTLTNAAEILTSTGDDAKLHGVYIRELSSRYLWVQRTGAYDREQDRIERERLIEERRDMIRRHRMIANDLTAKAKTALGNLAAEKMTPLDIVRFFRLATVVEANAYGMPGETVAITGAGGGAVLVDDLSAYTPEERRERLAEIARELGSRAAAPVDDMTVEDM
jgi:hypothetical protein